MSKRTIALVVSVALAAVATVALISYIRGKENKIFEGAKTVEVFVAKDTIPAGTTGDLASSKGLIEKTAVPEKVAAVTAIRSLEEIKGKIAAVTIEKGEQIISPRFVLPGQLKAALPIPTGKVAISVQVGIPPGVAGFVQPGDHVSIIARLSVPKKGGFSGPSGTAPSENRVQFLLQNVEVLAVGQRVVTVNPQGQQTATTQNTGGLLATVALTNKDAEKLAFAIFEGELYFVLLPEGSKPVTTPGRTSENAFQ